MGKQKTSRDNATPKAAAGKRAPGREPIFDVVIVGAGPAGSTLAWKLASAGLNVIALDGARFPREKVCGDYVEPRGLRVLENMGCLQLLEKTSPLPITHSSTYVDSRRRYRGKIPFYGVHDDLPPHGYIVPRDIFDNLLLQTAVKAGATIHQETYVTGCSRDSKGIQVQARCGGVEVSYRGRLLVGADGVNSVVARCAGLLADDPRHIALSQRAYADGFEADIGEAMFLFDGEFFPGYGWAFPMSQGRVNLGVGILKETCQRNGIAVPELFRKFFEKLKRCHPRCRKLKLCRPPIGGIVKTYGGAGRNYFDRGLLVGDAGSFVDPMTGEGITPAMESALIAARVILDALAQGRFNLKALSAYETEFRRYFDPSMIFLDLCAATLRNEHYWGSWRRALERGCDLAQNDASFARTAGACFGGLEVSPPGILGEIWLKSAESLFAIGPQSVLEFINGKTGSSAFTFQESAGWLADSWKSLLHDPLWHMGWAMDVQKKWMHALSVMGKGTADPRIQGVA
jgi:geranylgeranyl reductase family protein